MRRMLAPIPKCRYCGHALSPLRQRLADSCEAPACRHRAVMVPQLQRRRALLEARRAHAAECGHDPRLLDAPVVWLRHHDTDLAALTAQERAGHAAELDALAADPDAHPRKPGLAGWPDGYACDALQAARWHLGGATPGGALLAAAAGGDVPAAAWLHAMTGRPRTRKLPRLPKSKCAAPG